MHIQELSLSAQKSTNTAANTKSFHIALSLFFSLPTSSTAKPLYFLLFLQLVPSPKVQTSF